MTQKTKFLKEVYFSISKWWRGHQAEQQACDYLQQQGLQLLAQNFRSRWGEIDLIMRQQQWIVFVEVRYRQDVNFGSAAESVSKAKQQRLIRTARYYLHQQQAWAKQLDYRFDIIGISPATGLQWIQNAFSVNGYE